MGTRKEAAAAGVVAGVAVGVVAVSLAGCGSSSSSGASTTAAGTSPSVLQGQYESIVTDVLPSVVQIFTNDGTGSGVVYDSKGDIVTNAHVVGTESTVKVIPATGGTELSAKVLGTFKTGDLAVIRVASDAGNLKVASWGDSGNLKAGQIVMAMGNPLGLTGSVSQGIVSALGRTVTAAGSASGGDTTTITDAIQTTAAINGGNSGGALVDLAGQIVGIPSAAARDPEGGAAPGIGFAIPSDTAKDIADQIISTGKVTNTGRAGLGIEATTVATAGGEEAGVGVISTESGGAAANAGLKAGDVITELAGHQVPSVAVLNAYLAQLKPGDQVKVTYHRPGSNATSTATVTLGTLTS